MFDWLQRLLIKRKLKKLASQYYQTSTRQWVFPVDKLREIINQLPLNTLNEITIKELTNTGIRDIMSIAETLDETNRLFTRVIQALSNGEYASDIIRGYTSTRRPLLTWIGIGNPIRLGDALLFVADNIDAFEVQLTKLKLGGKTAVVNYNANFQKMFLNEVATLVGISMEALESHFNNK